MRTVKLTEHISSSVIGFGCAPILGSVDAKKAKRSLEAAFDFGITHFDLARSYGYGDAEGFFGKVMKGKRDKLVIATKFGITANWKARILKPLKPIVRLIKARNNKSASQDTHTVAATSSTLADQFLDRVPLRAPEFRLSIERSLKALKTDYLDYLFIHEPLTSIIHFDELVAIATQLKDEGKLRAWGLAYMRAQEQLHTDYLDLVDVLQFDNSPGAPGYQSVVAKRGLLPNVIFSPLRGGANVLSPSEKLRKLFTDFPRSVVLCSMFNEKHLENNVKIACEGPV